MVKVSESQSPYFVILNFERHAVTQVHLFIIIRLARVSTRYRMTLSHPDFQISEVYTLGDMLSRKWAYLSRFSEPR
jgi:hypothetical protein